MSCSHLTTSSSNNFQLIINNALKAYEKHTKKDLLAHPLASQLQNCNSPAAILAILQQQAQGPDQSGSGNDRWTKFLNPTINVLYTFSATLGEGVGLVSLRTRTCLRYEFMSYTYGRYSHRQKSYLLALVSFFWCALFLISLRSQYNAYISQAAKDVREGQDNLVDAFERIESFSDVSRSTPKCRRPPK